MPKLEVTNLENEIDQVVKTVQTIVDGELANEPAPSRINLKLTQDRIDALDREIMDTLYNSDPSLAILLSPQAAENGIAIKKGASKGRIQQVLGISADVALFGMSAFLRIGGISPRLAPLRKPANYGGNIAYGPVGSLETLLAISHIRNITKIGMVKPVLYKYLEIVGLQNPELVSVVKNLSLEELSDYKKCLIALNKIQKQYASINETELSKTTSEIIKQMGKLGAESEFKKHREKLPLGARNRLDNMLRNIFKNDPHEISEKINSELKITKTFQVIRKSISVARNRQFTGFRRFSDAAFHATVRIAFFSVGIATLGLMLYTFFGGPEFAELLLGFGDVSIAMVSCMLLMGAWYLYMGIRKRGRNQEYLSRSMEKQRCTPEAIKNLIKVYDDPQMLKEISSSLMARAIVDRLVIELKHNYKVKYGHALDIQSTFIDKLHKDISNVVNTSFESDYSSLSQYLKAIENQLDQAVLQNTNELPSEMSEIINKTGCVRDTLYRIDILSNLENTKSTPEAIPSVLAQLASTLMLITSDEDLMTNIRSTNEKDEEKYYKTFEKELNSRLSSNSLENLEFEVAFYTELVKVMINQESQKLISHENFIKIKNEKTEKCTAIFGECKRRIDQLMREIGDIKIKERYDAAESTASQKIRELESLIIRLDELKLLSEREIDLSAVPPQENAPLSLREIQRKNIHYKNDDDGITKAKERVVKTLAYNSDNVSVRRMCQKIIMETELKYSQTKGSHAQASIDGHRLFLRHLEDISPQVRDCFKENMKYLVPDKKLSAFDRRRSTYRYNILSDSLKSFALESLTNTDLTFLSTTDLAPSNANTYEMVNRFSEEKEKAIAQVTEICGILAASLPPYTRTKIVSDIIKCCYDDSKCTSDRISEVKKIMNQISPYDLIGSQVV